MRTDASAAVSVTIFAPNAEVGVEVLVLQEMHVSVPGSADLFGIELREQHDAVSAVDVRRLAESLFPDITSPGDDPDRARVGAEFLDQLLFTRQIPIAQSPLETWSLAEIWTKLGGAASGVGIGVVAGGHWPVMILTGMFGTLLIKPLTAISDAIAAGVADPVREATEIYARRWLRQAGDAPAREAPAAVPADAESPASQPRRRLTEDQRTAAGRERRELRLRDVDRSGMSYVLQLRGKALAVRDELRLRLAPEDLDRITDLVKRLEEELDHIYKIDFGDREESIDEVDWNAALERADAVSHILNEMRPLVAQGDNLAKFHFEGATNIAMHLQNAYYEWHILRNLPD